MAAPVHRVALVVDPEFGDRIHPISQHVHVWAADTAANRRTAERVWAESAPDHERRGVTVFTVDLTRPRAEWVAGILETIATHHGVHSHDPPMNALQIYGVGPTAELRRLLAHYGLTEIEGEGDAFLAKSPSAA